MFDLLPSVLLVGIFIVLTTKHVVHFIGKTNVQNAAWAVYTNVASRAGHAKFANLAAKRAELVEINRQRRAISAQDQYAKWTKLNRQFDAVSAEVQTLADDMSGEKARFTKLVSLAVAATTTAPIWFSRFMYRKNVLFYLAPGVLPPKVEWVLALPFMSTGAVGLTVWMFAVNSVLASVEFLISFYCTAAVEKPQKEKGKTKSEIPVEKTETHAEIPPVEVD